MKLYLFKRYNVYYSTMHKTKVNLKTVNFFPFLFFFLLFLAVEIFFLNLKKKKPYIYIYEMSNLISRLFVRVNFLIRFRLHV